MIEDKNKSEQKRRLKAAVIEKQKGNIISQILSIILIIWIVVIICSLVFINDIMTIAIIVVCGGVILVLVRAWHNTILLRE